MRKKILIAALFMSLTTTSLTDAHSLWVSMTDWNPAAKENPKTGLKEASTRMYIGWGHKFPVDSLTKTDQFASLTLISPSHVKTAIHIESEGISTSELKGTQSGPYVFSILRKPSINTSYMESGKLKRGKGPKTDFTNVVESIYSQQMATSHFHVGNEPFTSPLQAENILEIIPIKNPYDKDANYIGTLFPVKVIFDGKPLAYTHVAAAYTGFSSDDSMSQRVLTDANGIAHIRVTHWGPWIIKVKAERKATEKIAPLADKEVYYASTMFEI